MNSDNRKVIYALTFAPVGWGVLSFFIFSVLQPKLPNIPADFTPWWIWLWFLQMVLVIPYWIWTDKLGLYSSQRKSVRIFNYSLSLGSPKFYLWLTYLAVLPAVFTYNRWYGMWLVFGGIVSPVFEELFSRYLLTPWLRESWFKYLGFSIISSISFSIMHWGFNNALAFSLPFDQQVSKFISHFVFGMILCLIFRFTKSVQVVIWLHILSNLQFILTKL